MERPAPTNSSPRIIRFGAFEVDLHTGELRRRGQRVKLQDQPFRVLATLLERPGDLISREEPRNKLWPSDTFVDFDHSLNAAIKRLREALGESADAPVFIETMARRGYRFIAPVSTREDVAATNISPDTEVQKITQPNGIRRLHWMSKVITGAVVAALVASSYFYFARTSKLTDKDTIVLADFTNTTGDSVFDDTLKQGLRVQLEQSPFLKIVSDQRVDEQLRLMGHPAGERLTGPLAQELCQRVGAKAVLNGAISRLGTHYVVGLSASRCNTEDTLGSEQVEADNPERVLGALGEATTKMRRKLGESLASVQKYDTALEQATTPSLEALKAYSIGMETWRAAGADMALPFLQRAVELDPKFAMAYARLGRIYTYLRKPILAGENARKAYELRDKVSEREQLFIEGHYYRFGSGDMEKAVPLYEIWQQTYRRDSEPYGNLAYLYGTVFGKYEAALSEAREAVRLEPDDGENYYYLCLAYRWLNRPDEAERALKQAEQHRLESKSLLHERHNLAFLKGDSQETSLAETSEGRLRRVRELLRPEKGVDCDGCADLGLIEAFFGLKQQARFDTDAGGG